MTIGGKQVDIQQRIESAKDVLKIQGWDGNWNYDPYMMGLYNGMELMLSMIEDREPVFKEKPDKWLADNSPDEKLEVVSE